VIPLCVVSGVQNGATKGAEHVLVALFCLVDGNGRFAIFDVKNLKLL